MTITSPLGSWSSPVSAEFVGHKGTRFGHMQSFSGAIFWLESRANEQGRGVIVRHDGRQRTDVNGKDSPLADLDIRSKVHEYGGADFLVTEQGIFAVEQSSQAVVLIDIAGTHKKTVSYPSGEASYRFTDLQLHPNGEWLFAVCEKHKSDGVENCLVRIDLQKDQDNLTEVASGYDFYSFPRLSPAGKRLCWTCWNQPQMPWDGCELWLADVNSKGELVAQHQVLGGSDESIYQPGWSSDGVLHCVSDRSGYWNLYSFRDGVMNALTPLRYDFGNPQWIFGTSSYGFGDGDNLYVTYFDKGKHQLAHVNTDTGHIEPFDLPLTSCGEYLIVDQGSIYLAAGAEDKVENIYRINISDTSVDCLSSGEPLPFDASWISPAEFFEFPTSNQQTAYGYYYAPKHPDFESKDSSNSPPLIVMSHGGPTAATHPTLSWAIQFWTTRGFAVADINYRGSTGFGREYRQLLNGQWGIADVEDCVNAALFLVKQGRADVERMAIRGGSAGGLTTLCALIFHDVFSAGMTRYGVADLKSIVTDSHKFEARYLDNLVGPYPESLDLYEQRSPINFADKLSCPVLILQGSDDKVVPPDQSRRLAEAAAEKGIAHHYIEFEGEAHGFRKQANITYALQAELAFYRQVFGIQSTESDIELDLNVPD